MSLYKAEISIDRAREIAELAEFLADEYFPNNRIEPLQIIKEKEITHTFSDYGDAFDGLLEYKYKRFHIFVNQNRLERLDKPRARFTLGHELGHFFIDKHRNALIAGKILPHGSLCEYQSDATIELEADHFSSHLLMPSHRFSTIAQKATIGLEGIKKIAETFGTSITASAVRYVKQEIVPCAILKWKNGTLEWKWLSTEIFRSKFRQTIKTIEELPPDCSTVEAANGKIAVSEILRTGSTAATWFRFVSASSARNEILIEEAMSLGKFGVLTFLYSEKI